jgi:hypothetical protein
MLMPRPWRRPVRTSPLLSSRALVRGSVSSHAEGGRHVNAQLNKRAFALCPSVVRASNDSSRRSVRFCAVCRESLHCDAAIVPRLLGLTSWISGGPRVPARPCREAFVVGSCMLLGLSKGRKASHPLSMAL